MNRNQTLVVLAVLMVGGTVLFIGGASAGPNVSDTAGDQIVLIEDQSTDITADNDTALEGVSNASVQLVLIDASENDSETVIKDGAAQAVQNDSGDYYVTETVADNEFINNNTTSEDQVRVEVIDEDGTDPVEIYNETLDVAEVADAGVVITQEKANNSDKISTESVEPGFLASLQGEEAYDTATVEEEFVFDSEDMNQSERKAVIVAEDSDFATIFSDSVTENMEDGSVVGMTADSDGTPHFVYLNEAPDTHDRNTTFVYDDSTGLVVGQFSDDDSTKDVEIGANQDYGFWEEFKIEHYDLDFL